MNLTAQIPPVDALIVVLVTIGGVLMFLASA